MQVIFDVSMLFNETKRPRNKLKLKYFITLVVVIIKYSFKKDNGYIIANCDQ